MKTKISIIILILVIMLNFSGCIEKNNPINGNNNKNSPELVYIDDDYDENTSGWGYDHFRVIEDGLGNVSKNGTIFINNGMYFENLLVNKTVHIIGENNKTTIINGDRLGNVISVTDFYCTIQNINISNAGSYSGINVLSRGNKIFNNTLYNNYYGIWIDSKSENIIHNNSFIKNFNAIRLRSVSDSIISNNRITNNEIEGILLETCLRISILNNTFQKSGIFLSGQLSSWDSHKIEDNKINSKFIYYLKNKNGINIPTDALQIILVNCSNIEIKNFKFEGINNAIQMCYASDIIIEDNEFKSNIKDSIFFYHCVNNTIKNNNIDGGNGLNLFDSKNTEIINNLIENTDKAINFDSSNYNNLSENTILNNENGVYSKNGRFNNIFENTITSNNEYGIYFLTNSNNNKVFENTINQNRIALRIKGSRYNEIYENQIIDNINKGIYICCAATDNVVFKNSFINNDQHVDYTILSINLFYKDGFGNYWDDYTSRYPEAGQINGVWDIPYEILNSNAIDQFPLVTPPFT